MYQPVVSFRPTWWLPGRHAETIYAKFRQPPLPSYRRERRMDSSGMTKVAYDFVDALDGNAPLVVLFTGLEGASDSHYARALMLAVKQHGWHGVVVHYRSCGGVENTAPFAYHAGDSAEAEYVLSQLAQEYAVVYAVGVSLGGNILAKYLGEAGRQTTICAAGVVSAPLDLAASAESMAASRFSTLLYSPYFLSSLCAKAREMAQRYPELGLDKQLDCWTLPEFDRRFTVPLNGFADLQDYYARCSALPLLQQITCPTLIINACNDPLLRADALPTTAQVSESVRLYQPARGGHVGFVSGAGWGRIDWLPEALLAFFTQIGIERG